jgi:uncharacterized protein YqjF (DUF2071 family)
MRRGEEALTPPIDRLAIQTRPSRFSIMRQEWGKLLFMHWPIDADVLRPLVPKQLTIDTFEGKAWIGVVPFTMWGIRPSFTPCIPGLNAFHELNVRTYVHYDGMPGVWFFSLDANHKPAVWTARNFFNLPYYDATMELEQKDQTIKYSSRRTRASGPPAEFRATWEIGEPIEQTQPSSLEFFLTERYCLYATRGEKLFRLRIFHPPWPLRKARVADDFHSTMIEALGIETPKVAPLLNYAEALKVDIWPLRKL